MGGTNQFGTNTCAHNKKLNHVLNHVHLFLDFPKSIINEYSVTWNEGGPVKYEHCLVELGT